MVTTGRIAVVCFIALVVVTVLFSHLTTPFDPLHNDGYQFWSGIGANAFLITWAAVWWRKHNCHVSGCPYLQWHSTAAGDCVCRKHHPDGQQAASEILLRHMEVENKNSPTHDEIIKEIKTIQKAVGVSEK